MSLTQRTVKAAKPPKAGREDIPDGKLAGFALRTYYTGRKVFIARYRLRADGKEQLFILGNASVLTVAQARKAFKALMADVAEGIDPQGERRAAKSAEKPLTFTELADKWMEDHAKPKRRSWKNDERRLIHVKAAIGKKKAAEVTTLTLTRLHNEIGKKRGKIEANRVITLVRGIFFMGVGWKYLPHDFDNPASGVTLNPEPKRTRIVRHDEWPALLEAIRDYGDPIVAGAILTLLFTGLRKRDVLNLLWSDVDLDAGFMALRTQKTDEPRIVRISPSTNAVFTALPRFKGNPHVFPGRKKGKPLQEIKGAWGMIRTKAGCPDLRLHDLKRTVGTRLALSGENAHIISKVLGHRNQDAAKFYVQLAAEMVSGVMDRYAEQVEAAAAPKLLTEGTDTD